MFDEDSNSFLICLVLKFSQVVRVRIHYRTFLVLFPLPLEAFEINTTSDRPNAEPHSSVGSVADLSPGGRWFDPRLGQYSSRALMIVIATGFIPLSPLSVVLTKVTFESSQWLGNNIVRSTC